tara:strand:- start:4081 stop:5418 length:1338 start_codon:yes stop_codon:yes gene_type:complete
MSTSSMMSGLDSIFHATTYDGFNARNNSVNYLSNFLKEHKYNVYFICFFTDGFRLLGDVFDGITTRKLKNMPSENRNWTNEEITKALKLLLKKNKIKEPYFFYINYNCRFDPKTNQEVCNGLNLVNNYFPNSENYLIMNSDHGYPDPSRKLTREIGILGHDLIMTEDNITTPLLIIGKGFKENLKIKERVSLLDISELIKAIVNDKLNQSKLYRLANGLNIDKSNCATWNRYIAQEGAKLALTENKYKVIYDLDSKRSDYFQINSYLDSSDEWKLLESNLKFKDADIIPDEIIKLNGQIKLKLIEVKEYFSNKLRRKFEIYFSKNAKKICFIGTFTPTYADCLKKSHKNTITIDIRHIKKYRLLNKKDKLFIYVIYGTSITRWIRELFILYIRGYPIYYYTTYDLDKPSIIFKLLQYLPKMFFTLIDVYRSWGLVNTIKRIKNKF